MNTPALLPGFEFVVPTRYFSLGRHALAAGLKMLGIGKGETVLLPEYICRDLLAAVRAVQAVPIYYPVDSALSPLTLSGAAGAKAKAVIAVNYFGFPQDLRPFHAYCAAHGAALIEDNAHGFLSVDASGKPLGCRGDLGILSFRKTYAMPDGAALLVNREDWADRLPLQLPCSELPLSTTYIARRFLGRIQGLTGMRVRTVAEQAVRRFRRWNTGHAIAPSPPESEVLIPGEPEIHCESVRILEGIDAEREVRRRRDSYRHFEDRLGALDVEPVFAQLPEGVSPYGYPFRSTDATAEVVTAIARKMGYECGRWPDLPATVVSSAPAFYRNVRWVNFLC